MCARVRFFMFVHVHVPLCSCAHVCDVASDTMFTPLHHGVAPQLVALALSCLCNCSGRSYTVCGTKHLNSVPLAFAHMLASFAFYVLFSKNMAI